jgi:hypothetical protein
MRTVVVLFALWFMFGAPAVAAAQDLGGSVETGSGPAGESGSAVGEGGASGGGGGLGGGLGGGGTGGSGGGGHGTAAEPLSLGLTALGLAGAAFVRRLVR